ncbi:hypothetical protein [Parasitella parasitica]|uniref:Uncharacterized protein n=1 Tax=Parasitella parasitica TaxID=35722 RepID=A0A0B7NNP1_9FUNG|nr:hypothetical protein [Parasitella parasitica]
MSTFPLAFKRTRASSSKTGEKILKKRLAETLQSSSIVVVPSPSIGGGDETLSIDQDEEENLTIVDDLAFEDNNFLVDDGLFDEGEETVEIFESITSSADEDGKNDSEDNKGHDDYSQESLKHSFRIPNNPFSAIEKFSILFEEVCDNFTFSREGCKCVLALHISRKSTKHLIPYLLLSFIALDSNNFYDGKMFRELYKNKVIDNDTNVLKIFLKIDLDGFTCSSSRTTLIMMHAVILNLDSSESSNYKKLDVVKHESLIRNRDNPYGIKKAGVFSSLSTHNLFQYGFDELHGFSNVSKVVFDLIAPRYNASYKYIGNESEYPFQLAPVDFEAVKLSMAESRKYIPAGAFQFSFKPMDMQNVKTVVGLFDDENVRTALLGLSRALALALQWEISKNDMTEIEASLKTWFRFLDQMIEEKRLSNCIYTITMHNLTHLPLIIQQCSSLRNISMRSLEREIGNYKRKMRARVAVEQNALNVIEKVTYFKFLETTKMIDFSVLYDRDPDFRRSGFINHPAVADEGDQDYPQLWKPFGKPTILQANNMSEWIENLVPMFKFIEALKAYKRRFQSLRRSELVHVPVQNVTLLPASKMWSDSHIMVSALFKSLSNSNNSDRGGEYVIFESNIRRRLNHVEQPVPHWYCGRLLFFFEANLLLSPGANTTGSLYAIREVMKSHKNSPYSKAVAMVQPFFADEAKKYAVIDVADIISTVGLIQKIEFYKNNKPAATNWFYLISPSTSFKSNISLNAGKISEL